MNIAQIRQDILAQVHDLCREHRLDMLVGSEQLQYTDEVRTAAYWRMVGLLQAVDLVTGEDFYHDLHGVR